MGTSAKFSDGTNPFEDHPHACGDKSVFASGNDLCMGSSPRVWGQDIYTVGDKTKAGIIPTRVGTRTEITVMLTELEDHPHACGDKHFIILQPKNTTGSSPRVWGQV